MTGIPSLQDPAVQVVSDLALLFGDAPVGHQADVKPASPPERSAPPDPVATLVEQALKRRAGRGDTAVYWENLVREVCAAAKLGDASRVDEAVEDDPRFCRDFLGGQELVYLTPLRQAEGRVSANTRRLASGTPPWHGIGIDAAIAASEAAQHISLSPSQRDAVATLLGSKFTVITGGPGTGKTTMTKVAVHALLSIGTKVALCAPTGRAARRLGEATGREASTIHRLLGVGRNTKDLSTTPDIDADVVVIDEASMCDIQLTDRLLGSIRSRAAVVFLGDADQLPSVGPGQVLADLIGSGIVPCVRLTDVHRQAADSGIVINADRIITGGAPASVDGKADFVLLDSPNDAETATRLEYLATKLIPEKMGVDPLKHIQVLAPTRNGVLGTRSLNRVLQKAHATGQASAWTQFRAGDRVMQTVNNYDRGVFNGDIGFVTWVNDASETLRVEFSRTPVVYQRAELDELSLAYAITVHKSQGSEFPVVLIPMTKEGPGALTRRLLYTAVTRASRKVIVVGHADAVRRAVGNARDAIRVSGLLHLLRGDH